MGSYREVTTKSWASRMGGAFTGVLIGLLLFILSFVLLGWNEYRSIKEYKGLKQMQAETVPLASPTYDPAYNGMPVHLTGMATSAEVLRDPTFMVSGNVLKLRRVVEMYQWQETTTSTTRQKVGGGEETITEYSYNQVWSENAISSNNFKYHTHPDTGQQMVNPSMAYTSQTFTATTVTVGDFTLNDALKAKISGYQPLSVETVPSGLPAATQIRDGGLYIPASLTGSLSQAQVGDYRVRFEVVAPAMVSLVAVQTSNRSFMAYQDDFQLLSMGEHDVNGMFEQAQSARAMLTWILRGVGFLMMLFGMSMMLKPLSVVMDVIPILGRITGAGIFLICFILSLVLSLVTIGIMWLAVRPVLGGIVLAAAAAFLVLFIVMRRGKKDGAAAAAAAPPPPPAS